MTTVSKCLLSTYYVPGAVLGTGNTAVNRLVICLVAAMWQTLGYSSGHEGHGPCSPRAHSPWGKGDRQATVTMPTPEAN